MAAVCLPKLGDLYIQQLTTETRPSDEMGRQIKERVLKSYRDHENWWQSISESLQVSDARRFKALLQQRKPTDLADLFDKQGLSLLRKAIDSVNSDCIHELVKKAKEHDPRILMVSSWDEGLATETPLHYLCWRNSHLRTIIGAPQEKIARAIIPVLPLRGLTIRSLERRTLKQEADWFDYRTGSKKIGVLIDVQLGCWTAALGLAQASRAPAPPSPLQRFVRHHLFEERTLGIVRSFLWPK
jgi:hypothetical protein